MDKQTFMNNLLRERERWEKLLAQAGKERMLAPDLPGGWSVKDVIAHITWAESEVVGVLRQRAFIGSELWNISTDERNALVVEQSRSRSLDEIIATEKQTYEEFLALAQHLTDQELNDPHCFKPMPENWQPWKIMAGGFYEHYQEHRTAIEVLLVL